MVEATMLALVDGVRIVAPNSIELITPDVLHEQQDFFEDELPFVRGLLQAGQKVIDIGANYGVYTLSMAQMAMCGHSNRCRALRNSSPRASRLMLLGM
jgi:hypothetical protein